METESYWRKPYQVKAIRLAKENMEEVADLIDAVFVDDSENDPYIFLEGCHAWVGVWVVIWGSNSEFSEFWKNEDFVTRFQKDEIILSAEEN